MPPAIWHFPAYDLPEDPAIRCVCLCVCVCVCRFYYTLRSAHIVTDTLVYLICQDYGCTCIIYQTCFTSGSASYSRSGRGGHKKTLNHTSGEHSSRDVT